jgi:act minimal PKS chain-length factor (CLF/KS beta)
MSAVTAVSTGAAAVRPVVTGLGVVAPTGLGATEYWRAACAGTSAVGPITRFDASAYPVRLGAEARDFVADEHVPRGLVVQTDIWSQYALAAAAWALADADLPPVSDDPDGIDPFDVAVVTSSSSGGNAFGQRQIENLWAKSPKHVSAYQSIAWFYAASSGQLSIRHGLKGPCGVLASEGAGGLDAIGHARRLLRRGTRAVLCGGTEAPISPYALVCHLPAGQVTTSTDPTSAYRPFADDADGHVVGEGGAVLVIEDLATARERGAAQVYAEVAGYAATHDGTLGAPGGDGVHLARAAQLALADAGVRPDEVDAVFADAWGTRSADDAERSALAAVFGDRSGTVPVTAPKALVGRLHSGGAALDVATAALALHEQHLPPSSPAGRAWPADGIDLVLGEGRSCALETVLVLARGYGGFNAAVVLRRVAGDQPAATYPRPL